MVCGGIVKIKAFPERGRVVVIFANVGEILVNSISGVGRADEPFVLINNEDIVDKAEGLLK